jgi:hypothetical protein
VRLLFFLFFFFDLSFHCFSPFDDGLWFSLFTLERFKSSSFSLQFISQQGLPLRLFLLTTFEEWSGAYDSLCWHCFWEAIKYVAVVFAGCVWRFRVSCRCALSVRIPQSLLSVIMFQSLRARSISDWTASASSYMFVFRVTIYESAVWENCSCCGPEFNAFIYDKSNEFCSLNLIFGSNCVS